MQTDIPSERTWIQGEKSPYQLRDITHFPDWGRLTVADAWFNNLTAGLMLAAGIAWAAGRPHMAGLLPYAMTVALALLLLDLGLLIADLGDPPRFVHSLRVMRLTSPLSVGVWALSCYGIFLGIATIMSWIMLLLSPQTPSVAIYMCAAITRLCTVMAIVAAIVVICYKGVVFSCSSQPGVSQARWLTPFMVSDSLLMGMGTLTVLAVVFSPDQTTAIRLILPLIVLLIARCLTFSLLWQDVKNRARLVFSKDFNRRIGAMVYIVGGVIPLFLLFCGPVGVSVAAILFLFVGVFERRWIIYLTKPRP